MSIEDIGLEFPVKYEGLAILNFGDADLRISNNKIDVGVYLKMHEQGLKEADTQTLVLNFNELEQYSSAISAIVVSAARFCKEKGYTPACLAKEDNKWENMHNAVNLEKLAKVYYDMKDIPIEMGSS